MKHHFQALFDWHEGSFPEKTLVYRTDIEASPIIKLEGTSEALSAYADFTFPLAVSSYPFFESQLTPLEILNELRALLRVAKEVRLAPHRLEQKEVHDVFGPVILELQREEVGVEVKPLAAIPHAVMVRCWAQSCRL